MTTCQLLSSGEIIPHYLGSANTFMVCNGLFALKGFDSFAELNLYSAKR